MRRFLFSTVILRHAWLSPWNKHMTTGRINQISIVCVWWSWFFCVFFVFFWWPRIMFELPFRGFEISSSSFLLTKSKFGLFFFASTAKKMYSTTQIVFTNSTHKKKSNFGIKASTRFKRKWATSQENSTDFPFYRTQKYIGAFKGNSVNSWSFFTFQKSAQASWNTTALTFFEARVKHNEKVCVETFLGWRFVCLRNLIAWYSSQLEKLWSILVFASTSIAITHHLLLLSHWGFFTHLLLDSL